MASGSALQNNGAVNLGDEGRWVRLTAPAVWVVMLCASAAEAAPTKVHVRGGAQLEAALAAGDGDGLVVRGELHDDAQSALGATGITLRVAAPRGAAPGPLPSVRACGTTPRGAVRATTGNEIAVETDERGAFCVALSPSPPPGSVVHAAFAGSKLHDATDTDLPVGAEPVPPARPILRFDPATPNVDLDKAEVALAVTLKLERGDGARAPGRREGLRVVLEDERGHRIAEAPTGGDGRARFDASTASLDGPGAGELRARFEGSDSLGKATAIQPVVRSATAQLSTDRKVIEGDPDDGVPLDVTVTSTRGPVEGGIVEAVRGSESVGAAEVKGGRARVLVTFAAERAGDVPVSIRYMPAAPWWHAGPELRISVHASGPGPWRQALLAAVVAALAAWIVRGWRRAPKPPYVERDSLAPSAPVGRAGIQIVEASVGGEGWRGRVVDAHEGAPIAGATLTVIVPSFEGDGIIAQAQSDEHGEFTLNAKRTSDARLSVESRLHATHEQALPMPSVLVVALITRRRVLLDRLVRWARRYGQPFDGPPEPTPGHVRRVASRVASLEVESWAKRVESAAFGPDPVDAAAEHEAREGEPGAPSH